MGNEVYVEYDRPPAHGERSWLPCLASPRIRFVAIVGGKNGYTLSNAMIYRISNARTIHLCRLSIEPLSPYGNYRLGRLRHLWVQQVDCSESTLCGILDRSPHLRSLTMTGMKVSAEALERIVFASDLRGLSVTKCVFSEANWLSMVSSRPDLRELAIADTELIGHELAMIGRMISLEHLHVECNEIDIATIRNWQSLSRLVSLCVSVPGMNPDSQLEITEIKSLSRLYLVTDRVDARVVKAIAAMPKLRVVGLYPRDAGAEARNLLASLRPDLDVR